MYVGMCVTVTTTILLITGGESFVSLSFFTETYLKTDIPSPHYLTSLCTTPLCHKKQPHNVNKLGDASEKSPGVMSDKVREWRRQRDEADRTKREGKERLETERKLAESVKREEP